MYELYIYIRLTLHTVHVDGDILLVKNISTVAHNE